MRLDWITGTMLTLNEVALLFCSSPTFPSNTIAQKQFSTGALCAHVNEPELQVLDMTPVRRSCVRWLAALRKHMSQCQPSLPSTPFWHPLFPRQKEVSATTKWKQPMSKWWRIERKTFPTSFNTVPIITNKRNTKSNHNLTHVYD